MSPVFKLIAEIQQELRSIRTELQKMDSRLSALDDKLVNYKDAVNEDSKYKRI